MKQKMEINNLVQGHRELEDPNLGGSDPKLWLCTTMRWITHTSKKVRREKTNVFDCRK